jgi:adenylate cyclase
MPKLGLREVTRARTAILSAAPSRGHGILLTFSTRWPTPSSAAKDYDVRLQRRLLHQTKGGFESKPNVVDIGSVPIKPVTPNTVAASNEVPAREIPAPLGPIGIVFTDIVKSTNIWEKDTQAMISAMELHDNTVRSVTVANQGYEVKQNGDGFMLAFSTAISAVKFCLKVQEALLDEKWPKALLKLPPGKESTDDEGHLLFRGLQLRVSAHWGEPVSKWNEVIQRMDYLGPVVNRAARFVQVTEPGQIVVSEEFMQQLQDEMRTDNVIPALGETTDHVLASQPFMVHELGDYTFQGLDAPEKLYFIVPSSLEGRVEHWQQVAHVSGVKGNLKSG